MLVQQQGYCFYDGTEPSDFLSIYFYFERCEMSRLSILVLYMRQDICVQNKNGLKGVKPEIKIQITIIVLKHYKRNYAKGY